MSKVVFVGNVPYNMGEEQLIDAFKSVGQVVGFRLVYDRDTGKPKGYGFCEFADHDTALSAVRNLNGQDVGGRPLRIDLADSDPFLEGKTTIRGELVDAHETRAQWRERGGDRDDRVRGGKSDPNAFLASLPPGVPVSPGSTALDSISQMLATTNPSQILEVLAQMKAFVITHPEQARALLVTHPQLGYALFQALLLNKIVDPAILQRMLNSTTASQPTAPAAGPVPSAPPAPQAHVPPPAPYPHAPPHALHAPIQHPQPAFGHPPSISGAHGMPQVVPTPPVPTHTPSHAQLYGAPPPPSAQHMGPPPMPYYRPPMPAQHQPPPPQPQIQQPPAQIHAPQAAPAQQAPLPIDPAAKEMILQVLRLTPEQVNQLPPVEREQLNQLRKQYSHLLNAV
ncbi:unnamed protein product [Somion occarium]|uniref:RRM domain-containing protein n=1 Tax=Somion occarium TaxID=3059160 RepID=A0ABP1DP77_9APHY